MGPGHGPPGMEEVAEVLEEEGGVEEVEEALEDFSTLTLLSCSVFCACRCIVLKQVQWQQE